jgi:two-component system, cell cycle response regulator
MGLDDVVKVPRGATVLIVEHHEWSARALESILVPRGFIVHRALNGQDALRMAALLQPDAILLEEGLTDIPGTEVCRQLATHPSVGPATPILILTAHAETRQRRTDAFRAGAWDLVQMPPDVEELVLRLQTYIRARVARARAAGRGPEERWTGLYSRQGLLRRAAELAAEATRYERPLACVALSVGGGKLARGPAGTEQAGPILALLEQVFRSTVRSCDAVGRVAARQFAVLTPSTDEQGAHRLAERLVRTADSAAGTRASFLSVRAGYFGVSNYRSAAVAPAELLLRATTALSQQPADPESRVIAFTAVPSASSAN